MRRIAQQPLWIGHVGDVRDIRAVRGVGIEAVVDLALNEPFSPVARETVYCRFPMHDGAGNPAWLLRAAVFTTAELLRSGTPTLVFCSAGMSRSVCIAAAAMARVQGLPADECLTLIASSGPADVAPDLWRSVLAVL